MPVKLLAVTAKDLKLLFRDRGGLFFTFIFPILMAIFFGAMMSGSGDIKGISLLVINHDQTTEAQKFVDKLDAADEIKVTVMAESEARNQVRKGKAAAFLILPKGFGAAKSNLFSGEAPTVQLGVDPKRKAIKGLLQGVLIRYAAEDMQSMFTDTNKMQAQIQETLDQLGTAEQNGDLADSEKADRLGGFLHNLQNMMKTDGFNLRQQNQDSSPAASDGDLNGLQPLIIEGEDVVANTDGPANGYDISFPQGILWGILGCLSTFSLSLVSERNQGTLARLLVSSTSRGTLLAGKALACFITIIFITTSLLILGALVFGIQINQPAYLALSIVTIAICFSGMMIMFSVISKSEKAASGITWAAMLIMSMLGGGMIPLAFLPPWMSIISQFSPVKWAILALEGPLWRNFSLPELLPALGILMSIGIAGFIVGERLFSWQSNET